MVSVAVTGMPSATKFNFEAPGEPEEVVPLTDNGTQSSPRMKSDIRRLLKRLVQG